MSVDRFRFVSPGVFINEIDQSQIEGPPALGAGPVVMGVAKKGPAMVPVTVSTYADFVDLYGAPEPGSTRNPDPWRNGNKANPMYGAYAAQAYLANGAPLTYIRLVGDQDPTANTAGVAGWEVPAVTKENNAGGAYGLFIIGSGSTGATPANNNGEGMLAAIFYTTGSNVTVELSGAFHGVGTQVAGAAALVDPTPIGSGTSREFKVRITGDRTGTVEKNFNFDPKSGRYIRKVFNTNPTLCNSDITAEANRQDYWLGQSFENSVVSYITTLADTDSALISRTDFTDTVGVILSLVSGSTGATSGGDFRTNYKVPATPWIVGQDLSDNSGSFDVNSTVEPLFRILAREGVEYEQRNYKISISDVKASPNPQFEPYGSFTLLVRSMQDTDENPVILEQFNNLNLDPASNNFIGKRIGDRSFSWDTTNKKWNVDGQYDVQSKYCRVECSDLVDAGGQDSALLPFGFKGVPTFRGFGICLSGSQIMDYSLNGSTYGPTNASSQVSMSVIGELAGTGSVPAAGLVGADVIVPGIPPQSDTSSGQVTWPTVAQGALITSASLAMPTLPMRNSSADGRLLDTTNAFFGLSTNQAASTLIFDGSTLDHLYRMPESQAAGSFVLTPGFSLDDLVYSATTGQATHSGSDVGEYFNGIVGGTNPVSSPQSNTVYRGTPQGGRRAGTSCTSVTGSYTGILDRGFDRFTLPMYGGFDGFDILERNPFNDTRALGGTNDAKDVKDYSAYYTLTKAIDAVADVDQININMAAIPGISDRQTTNKLMSMAEERKDTLAIIDLESGFLPVTEGSTSGPVAFNDRRGSSANTVTSIKDRDLNTSYACAYYPWMQINDTAASTRVWVPPSTVALGVMAASAARSELWFAPAGFNRGGLNNGNAGLNVINVVEKLTAKQRDNLYEVNINPIASFPSEGIVVFGQKTLQATPSALDRINVRRLMIYLRKQITIISNGILFDPNVQITWNRFINRVDPFLSSIQQRFGLADYRVILDANTTTPDLVDRNIMYAKILLKPTRAIEFIALDFVITRSGVEF